MKVIIRPYRSQDLGRVLKLWQNGSSASGDDGLAMDEAVDLMNSDDAVALVAEEVHGEIVGMTIGAVSAVTGWIYRLSVLPETPSDVAQQLVERLEARLAEHGARRLAMLLPHGSEHRENLERRGYQASERTYLTRELVGAVAAPTALEDVGGRMIDVGLWDDLKGMEEAKRLIERRIILPLVQPELASRHAVTPPKAILIFGPPGTGKTSFAKAVASRLDWPFVEVQPGELAGEGPDRQAKMLADTFDRVLDLPSAVVFVDEVEDLASIRQEERKVRPSVTNEFLKQIPRMRDTSRHLLVCATNFVGLLDPALLRPGRFNYIVPIGPPDTEARSALWERYVADITDHDVDVAALVEATELFTPADMEFAARQAAHQAFERAHFEGADHGATTQDFLAAIDATTPTLTDQMVDGFRNDAAKFTRY